MGTKKIGRPTNNPKITQIAIRFDSKTLKILDDYCNEQKINRAEGVRKAVEMLGRIKEK